MADLIFRIASVIALIAMLLAFWRLFRGPTSADRVVALDVLTIITISFIVFIACCENRIIYIDVALVYALVSFIGVVAIGRYIEKGI